MCSIEMTVSQKYCLYVNVLISTLNVWGGEAPDNILYAHKKVRTYTSVCPVGHSYSLSSASISPHPTSVTPTCYFHYIHKPPLQSSSFFFCLAALSLTCFARCVHYPSSPYVQAISTLLQCPS